MSFKEWREKRKAARRARQRRRQKLSREGLRYDLENHEWRIERLDRELDVARRNAVRARTDAYFVRMEMADLRRQAEAARREIRSISVKIKPDTEEFQREAERQWVRVGVASRMAFMVDPAGNTTRFQIL